MKRWNGRLTSRLTSNDEIDQILSRDDEILPSSGFAVSVMEAVRREAAAPPPIPFPWMRALPGMVVGGFALVLALVAGVGAVIQSAGASATPQVSAASPSVLGSIFQGSVQQGSIERAAIWTLVALTGAFLSIRLSMRLASGGL